jgi:hypothetical protein
MVLQLVTRVWVGLMGRPRTRVPLESGSRLDLADLIPRGKGKPGTQLIGRCVWTDGTEDPFAVELWANTGTLRLSIEGRLQIITLVPKSRHFGGVQWYALCPRTSRVVRVLYCPLGASFFRLTARLGAAGRLLISV